MGITCPDPRLGNVQGDENVEALVATILVSLQQCFHIVYCSDVPGAEQLHHFEGR